MDDVPAPYMTTERFEAIRKRANDGKPLTYTQLGRLLRVHDRRTVRRWETGQRDISGPVSVLMELLDAKRIPKAMIRDALAGD